MSTENTEHGRKELRHEARPGYRPVFLIVFALGVLYLVAVFALGIGGH